MFMEKFKKIGVFLCVYFIFVWLVSLVDPYNDLTLVTALFFSILTVFLYNRHFKKI
jgi:hypothetical protein